MCRVETVGKRATRYREWRRNRQYSELRFCHPHSLVLERLGWAAYGMASQVKRNLPPPTVPQERRQGASQPGVRLLEHRLGLVAVSPKTYGLRNPLKIRLGLVAVSLVAVSPKTSGLWNPLRIPL